MTRIVYATEDLSHSPHLVAGYDVGGTKVDVLVRSTDSGALVFTQQYRSSDFESLDAVIDQSLADLGARPGRIVLAIAGPRQANGEVKVTNQPDWPLFQPGETEDRLKTKVETVNDLIGPAAGLNDLEFKDQRVFHLGTPDFEGPRMVVTVSTGIGDALSLADGTLVPGEGGHTTWQPKTKLEAQYLAYLRRKSDTDTITVEVAASGGQGFDNLYDFLVAEGRKPWHRLSRRFRPSRALREAVEAFRSNGEGIGRAITAIPAASDPFVGQLMELLGSILGQYLRNRAVGGLPTGGIFFIGSVMQDAMEDLVHATSFLESFLGYGAQHHSLLARIPICLVTDKQVAVKGALELAAREA